MLFPLVLLFIVVPIVEIYVIIQVGQAIGALWTIALLVGDRARAMELVEANLVEGPALRAVRRHLVPILFQLWRAGNADARAQILAAGVQALPHLLRMRSADARALVEAILDQDLADALLVGRFGKPHLKATASGKVDADSHRRAELDGGIDHRSNAEQDQGARQDKEPLAFSDNVVHDRLLLDSSGTQAPSSHFLRLRLFWPSWTATAIKVRVTVMAVKRLSTVPTARVIAKPLTMLAPKLLPKT